MEIWPVKALQVATTGTATRARADLFARRGGAVDAAWRVGHVHARRLLDRMPRVRHRGQSESDINSASQTLRQPTMHRTASHLLRKQGVDRLWTPWPAKSRGRYDNCIIPTTVATARRLLPTRSSAAARRVRDCSPCPGLEAAPAQVGVMDTVPLLECIWPLGPCQDVHQNCAWLVHRICAQGQQRGRGFGSISFPAGWNACWIHAGWLQ